MVVLSLIDHGNSVPVAHVGGLPRARQKSSNSRCFIYMIATRTQLGTSVSALMMEAYRDPARCSYPLHPFLSIYPKFFHINLETYSTQNILNRNLSERKRLIVVYLFGASVAQEVYMLL